MRGMAARVIALTLTTCRARTGAMPNGTRNALRQARDIGPHTEALILAVLSRHPSPEQGFRTSHCLA